MARKPRIQFKGAFYHVIVRGNQKQSIFLDDADRNRGMEWGQPLTFDIAGSAKALLTGTPCLVTNAGSV
jgi:hypothetical protein